MSTLSWVKRLEEAIDESKVIPLWGAPPSFPWEEFSSQLSKKLNVTNLEISVEKTEWKNSEEYLKGLGTNPSMINLEFAPLSESFFWVISSEDQAKLTSLCLAKTDSPKGFSHPDFQEGFTHFLFLEVLSALEDIHAFSDLSLRLGKTTPFPKKMSALCLDIRISVGREVIRGRVICPSSAINSFRSHFSKHRFSLSENPVAQQSLLALSLEIGTTSLPWKKWKDVKVGDFVILERCTFDPLLQKGGITLSLGKIPLFRGRVKDHQIKILDYAFYYEDTMTLSDHENENESEDSEEFSSEGESTEESPQENQEPPLEKMLSSEEIPLTLTVEIGRLTLSIEKLLQIKPGNLLELGLHPDQGVLLTIEGKGVARGELVKVGDFLGVRVLEIGS